MWNSRRFVDTSVGWGSREGEQEEAEEEGGGGVEGGAGRGGVAEVVGAAPAVGQVILGVEAHIRRRDEEAACNGASWWGWWG